MFNVPPTFNGFSKAAKAYSHLTTLEKNGLVLKAQKGCQESVKVVVCSTLHVIVKEGRKLYSFGMAANHEEDICQEGIIGLLSAIKKFDSTGGVKFDTFSYLYVKGLICQYIQNNFKTMSSYKRSSNSVFWNLSRFRKQGMSDKEIADKCNTTVNDVKHVDGFFAAFGSDDELVTQEGDNSSTIYSYLEVNHVLKAANRCLTAAEYKILKLRLVDDQTWDQVSKQSGYSAQYSSACFRNSIKKLKEVVNV